MMRPLLLASLGCLRHTSVRFAKRRGVKAIRLAREAKLGIKPKKKAKPKAEESGPLPVTAAKLKMSVALQHPARDQDTTGLLEQPVDDVWYQPAYVPAVYSMSEALRMHRQLQHPTMLNNPSAPVCLRLDLNMALDRKKRYVDGCSGLLAMPYPFDHGQKRTLLAFAKDPSEQIAASESGAEITGGLELMKQVLKGTVRTDDVNYVLCHADIAADLNPLRGLLRKKFPSRKNGSIGTDLAALVKHFIADIEYVVEQDLLNPNWGVSHAVIGHLDMPDDHLDANCKRFIETVYNIRDPPKHSFIERAVVMLTPSEEFFRLDLKPYLPELPEETEEEDGLEEDSAA